MNNTELLNKILKIPKYYRNLLKLKSFNNDLYNAVISYYTDFKETDNIQEFIYRLKHDIKIKPVCKICKQPVKFYTRTGYSTYCSYNCMHQDTATVRLKATDTMIQKYGIAHYNNRAKFKETMLSIYGVETPLQNKELSEKRNITYNNTCLEKYGVNSTMKLDNVRHKAKQTMIERYGVDNSFKLQETHDKAKQTWLAKYGVDNPMKDVNIKLKAQDTIIERYGVTNSMQNSEVKEKSIETLNASYGVDNPMKSVAIKLKALETCKEKYGVPNPMQNKEIAKKSYKHRYEQNEYVGTSKLERDLIHYIKEYIDLTVITQYSSDLYPFHADCYLPKFDLYIELQGMWTHGMHAYNPNDNNDIETLNTWKDKALTSKFYQTAIKVWTTDDPLKRQTAYNNHLNYLEIFASKLDDAINILKEYLNNESTNI